MRIFRCCLACLLGLALAGTASAQVYESKDAQGNPVFSDKPSAGAEEVKVPPTNSADPVADAPRAASSRPRHPVQAQALPPRAGGRTTRKMTMSRTSITGAPMSTRRRPGSDGRKRGSGARTARMGNARPGQRHSPPGPVARRAGEGANSACASPSLAPCQQQVISVM